MREAIQKQMDSDLIKQNAYTKYGTAILADKDGNGYSVGVSRVIYDCHSDNDIGGYHFRTPDDDFNQEDSDRLVKEYQDWLDYKKDNFQLAGYKIASDDEQEIDLDKKIQDGQKYNIYVNHITSTPSDIFRWYAAKREVDFKYYYHDNDKNLNVMNPKDKPLNVIKNGYYNEGKYNSTQGWNALISYGDNKPEFSNIPANGNTPTTTVHDANSFESRLTDAPKTSKEDTQVLHDALSGRFFDYAVGLITDNQGALNNFGKAQAAYPSGTILLKVKM